MIEIRKIVFEDIDKNRWNGLVHYSPAPSVYSYHWYLKAVAGPFDLLVEENYESGMPVFHEPLNDFQKNLLPETGIHSINMLSAGRVKSFVEVLNMEYPKSWIAVKSGQSDVWQNLLAGAEKHSTFFLSLHQPYEEWMSRYTPEFTSLLQKYQEADLKIISNPKPEELLSDAPLNEQEKNILYRVMYNAMHRGILFTSQVSTKNEMATAVFIYGQGTVFEIWSHTGGDISLLAMLYDYLFRTHAGRNMTLRFSPFTPKQIVRFLNAEMKESVKIAKRHIF